MKKSSGAPSGSDSVLPPTEPVAKMYQRIESGDAKPGITPLYSSGLPVGVMFTVLNDEPSLLEYLTCADVTVPSAEVILAVTVTFTKLPTPAFRPGPETSWISRSGMSTPGQPCNLKPSLISLKCGV